MPIIPSGATHLSRVGNYYKLVSITPFKVMRWAGTKWIWSDYSRLGYDEFSLRTKKIKRKFVGNLHDTTILS